MTSFKPLTTAQQLTVSGVVIPSGEANFADFLQSGDIQDGLNSLFDASLSGVVLYLDPPASGAPFGDPTGTLDSAFAYIFGESEFSNADNASRNRNTSDLSDFKPYIHYYPKFSFTSLSLYSSTTISLPILIDYSLVFELSNYYNWYNYWGYNFPFGSIYDPNGDPVFSNPYLIPPEDYVR